MKRFNQKLPFIFILLLLVSCRATETSVQVVKVEDKYEMKLKTIKWKVTVPHSKKAF